MWGLCTLVKRWERILNCRLHFTFFQSSKEKHRRIILQRCSLAEHPLLSTLFLCLQMLASPCESWCFFFFFFFKFQICDFPPNLWETPFLTGGISDSWPMQWTTSSTMKPSLFKFFPPSSPGVPHLWGLLTSTPSQLRQFLSFRPLKSYSFFLPFLQGI